MAGQLSITRPRQRILEAILRYGLLSAEQVNRLFYTESALRNTRREAAALVQDQLLQRLYLHRSIKGNPLAIYGLTNDGWNHLRDQGLAEGRFRASEISTLSP